MFIGAEGSRAVINQKKIKLVLILIMGVYREVMTQIKEVSTEK